MASCDTAIVSISNAAGTTFDAALTEAFAVAEPLGLIQQDQVPFGIQLGAASYNRRVLNSYKSAISFCAVTRSLMADQLQTEVLKTFSAPANMDLRDVSSQFYGTPNEWRFLMTYNDLTNSKLVIGQTIVIPQLPADTNNPSAGRITA